MSSEEDKEVMDKIFRRFDVNGDGKISFTEVGQALKALGSSSSDETQRLMAEVDTDGDGFISFQEFSAFYIANPEIMKNVAKVFLP